MPAMTHQRNRQRRKNKSDGFKMRQQRANAFKHAIDPNHQGSLAAGSHLSGLKDEGYSGRIIMELIMLFVEFSFNTPYLEMRNEYNAKLKEVFDEYSDHDLIYVPRTPDPQSPTYEQEWAEIISQTDGEADAAYVITGDNRLFYVDMNKGTRDEVQNVQQLQQLKQGLGLTDQQLEGMVENKRLENSSELVQNLDQAIKTRRELDNVPENADLINEIADLEEQKRVILTQGRDKNVGVFVKGLNKASLDAISHFTRHQRRRFCLAYCKQNLQGQPDENGKFPPLYPIGADNEPDYNMPPVAPEKITPTLIRANGYIPIPTIDEGLMCALDRHWERVMGTNAMSVEQMLRCYGVSEIPRQGKGGEHQNPLADDNAARMAAMAQHRAAAVRAK